MSGFVDFLKVVLKIAALPLIILLFVSFIGALSQTGGAVSFLTSGFDIITGILNFIYRLFYFWTGGFIVYPYLVFVVSFSIRVAVTLGMAAVYSYKWYLRVLE